ncbi:hypothetical protein FRC14_001084 [Serendipita sp. 396]|nr:hypothetical protein FRC14_001084 [Serendipita sp. 396]KAG8801320.1 hypothetical protein FRC16_000747 [Serendipita sp. 398]
MVATAGLVSSLAIPISSDAVSTSTSRSIDDTAPPRLVKRVKDLLEHPFSESITAEENNARAKHSHEQGEAHRIAEDNHNMLVDVHTQLAKNAREKQAKATGRGFAADNTEVEHHEAEVEKNKKLAADHKLQKEMHLDLERAHSAAGAVKMIGPTGEGETKMKEGHDHYHNALHGHEELTKDGKADQLLQKSQSELKNGTTAGRMTKMSDAHKDKQAALAHQTRHDDPASLFPAGTPIGRAEPLQEPHSHTRAVLVPGAPKIKTE